MPEDGNLTLISEDKVEAIKKVYDDAISLDNRKFATTVVGMDIG